MKSHDPNHWKKTLSRIIIILGWILVNGCTTKANIPVTRTSTTSTAITIIPTLTPTLLPFAGKVAFSKWSDIYIMNTNGTGQEKLTDNLANSMLPTWSPDGANIAFTAGLAPSEQIFSIKADGSDQQQLTFSKGSSYWPSWSPDGEYLAFLSNRDEILSDQGTLISQVYIMNANGSNQRRLTNDRNMYSSLSWSPTGDLIATDVNVLASSGIYFPPQIYLMDLNGKLIKRLTTIPYSMEPAWSPDGKLIAFSDNGGIYVMTSDGTSLKRIIGGDAFYVSPSWSPDGKYIVFAAMFDIGSGYQLYIINSDGSNPLLLTHDIGDKSHPIWSPEP